MDKNNICVLTDEYITLKNEKITLSFNLTAGILTITAKSHKDWNMYRIILSDSWFHDYDALHLTNSRAFRQWILNCASKQHLLVKICQARRFDDDSPLILFIWDDNYVERIEIPRNE
jgi:hypothetical protein